MLNEWLPTTLQKHLVNLIDSVPEAIIISKNAQSILYANQYAEALFGYQKDELLGQSTEVLTPERYRQSQILHRNSYLSNPKSVILNEKFGLYGLKKDNSEFPVKITLGPITYGDDILLLSLIQDISNQRYLSDKYNLFSTLIDETKDAIEVVDPKTAEFIDGNKTAWEVLGYSQEEFLSLSVLDIDPLVNKITFDQLMDELKVNKAQSLQSIHKRKDGSTFPVEINMRYVTLDKDYVITVVRDVTELTKAQNIIKQQAKYDMLTNLPNRNMLRDTIEDKIHQDGNLLFSMLIINIRHFKEINNTIGHQFGDQLLRQFGFRIQKLLGNPEDLFYMGADEFAIILEGASQKAFSLAETILSALIEPFIVGDIPISIEVNIGIASYPEHGGSTDTLIRKASIAVDSAKKQEMVVLYEQKYDQYNPDHLAIMSELRTALHNDELLLYYQPKICLRENKVLGLEALVRWQNPKRGFLLPHQFIDLAEKTALITPLTFLTLDLALQQGLRWQRQGMDIGISVNISPRNFLSRTFPTKLADFLKNKVQNRVKFEFEITENTVMADLNHTVSAIKKIQALGGTFSIDDFGKDYSSLNYLKQLTVEKLKIDKAFIMHMLDDVSNQGIVEFIINLAHKLGMEVVAEGVDNADVLDKLKQLACDSAQGFYIGKPMPATQFNDWLQNSVFHL